MALVSDGAFVEDGWRRLADEEALPKSGKVIVSLPRLGLLDGTQRLSALGVFAPNTADVATLVPAFPRLSLIAVAFPAFTDGRGSRWRGCCAAQGSKASCAPADV
jgi:uncharacterized protein (DUF934 family)